MLQLNLQSPCHSEPHHLLPQQRSSREAHGGQHTTVGARKMRDGGALPVPPGLVKHLAKIDAMQGLM
jgi:hypothetical protein